MRTIPRPPPGCCKSRPAAVGATRTVPPDRSANHRRRDVQAVAGHQLLATTEVYLPDVVTTLEGAMEGREYRR